MEQQLIVKLKPNVADPKWRSGKPGRVTRVVGAGADQMCEVADENEARLGWFRSDELMPHVDVQSLRRETELLRQRVDHARTRIPSTSFADVEREVIRLADDYIAVHGLDRDRDLGMAVQHVLADPQRAELAAAWRRLPSQLIRGCAEDTQLATLVDACARAKGISKAQALREVSIERRDLAQGFHNAIHLTRRGDGSWARESAARDLELRRVVSERVDLAGHVDEPHLPVADRNLTRSFKRISR